MRQKSTPADPRLRRRRRILASLPATLLVWTVLAGLPAGPPEPAAPEVHVAEFDLTSPGEEAASGWTTALEVPAGSQSAGLNWIGGHDVEIEVRGRSAEGWSDWFHLHGNPDEGPDAQLDGVDPDAANQEGASIEDGASGELVWFGGDGVTEVEVTVESGPVRDLTLAAMRYEAPSSPRGLPVLTAAAGAADTRPTILPRSNWATQGWAYGNADCENGPIRAPGGTTQFAVVHHTVNSNTYSQADVPGMLASIYTHHTRNNGWCDIAYNFVIDRFGRIWEGRGGGVDQAIVGGHAAGFNSGSVGVAFLGQHHPGATPASAGPSVAAIDAAGRVIGWRLGLSNVNPSGTHTHTSSSGGGGAKFPKGTRATIQRVSGHRDVGHTNCPGDLLHSHLATIRATAGSIRAQTTPTTAGATTTTTTTPGGGTGSKLGPFSSVTALVNQQYRDILHREPTADERALWTAYFAGDGARAGDIIATLAESTEADTKNYAIMRLYRAYFLRNPDKRGFEFWLDTHLDGRSIRSISEHFAASDEFRARYGSLDDAAFVELMYRNVIGRASDPNGRAYWNQQLRTRSRGNVMASVSQTPEYRSITRREVQVAGLHLRMIRGAIDIPTFNSMVSGLKAGSTSLATVGQTFFERPHYAARFRS